MSETWVVVASGLGQLHAVLDEASGSAVVSRVVVPGGWLGRSPVRIELVDGTDVVLVWANSNPLKGYHAARVYVDHGRDLGPALMVLSGRPEWRDLVFPVVTFVREVLQRG